MTQPSDRTAKEAELQQVERKLKDEEMTMQLGITGGDPKAITALRERRTELRRELGLG